MRTTTLMRTALAVGGLAAALSLSACDGVTINFGGDEQAPASAEPTTDSGDDGTTGSDGTGSDTSGAGGTGDDSSGTDGSGDGDTGGDGNGGDGSGTDTSGGDSSQQNADFTLDERGNGTIPEATLERDIKQAYADQGTTVETVDCSGDMSVYEKAGSQTCDVTVSGKTYYGVVKVTDVIGQNVHYKLEFAGIDF